ncbi:DUF5317 domain-containing protein [Gudongella sp. SC589]|jgi:hypothetical protein|uniref:DUF5317 domain-containing protein n=1 Tax=Gudongella sp. SC589 TaxID=3385990 RepID=UPI003904714B
MFLEPATLSIIIAKLRGGKLRNLENVHIEGVVLLFLSALTQASLSLAKRFEIEGLYIFLEDYFIYVMVLSYTLLLIAIILNIEKNYMKVLFIGVMLNAAVIAANEGKMPVSMTGISGMHQESVIPERESDIKHIGVNQNTKLVYLADIILIPRPYPLPKILSIGDVFIMVGVFLFFQKEMKPR